MGFLQNLIQATTPKQNPNNLFMGPAPAQPMMPNPQAALGALGQALAQSQKQRQAASQAGSALAHKSHPQTLPGAQPQEQQQVNPAVGAQPPKLPSAQFQGQLDNLNKQQDQNIKNQQQAVEDYKAAMQQPLPDAPQYQQAQMQGPNSGLALGAALGALFAPGAAQGAIGALGVDQTNRENEYKREDEANQNQYKAQSGQYDSAVNNRENKIKDAEGLANLDDRLVTSGNTQIDNVTGKMVSAQEAEARQAETIANHARIQHYREVKQADWATHEENNQAWRRNLAANQAQALGISRDKLSIMQGTLDLGNRRLGQQLTEFGVSQHNIAVLQGIRTTAQLAAMYDRDEQGDKRESVRAMAQGLHDINNQITQLATHSQGPQAAAAIARLKALSDPTTPEGARLETAMKSLGTSGSAIGEMFDQETGVEDAIGTSLTAGTDAATPTPSPTATGAPGAAVTNITNNYGSGEATPDAGDPNESPLDKARRLVAGMGGSTAGLQSVDSGGRVHQAPSPVIKQPEDADQVEVNKHLPAMKPVWETMLRSHNGDANAAWKEFAPRVKGASAKQINIIRRSLFNDKGQGNKQPGKVPAP